MTEANKLADERVAACRPAMRMCLPQAEQPPLACASRWYASAMLAAMFLIFALTGCGGVDSSDYGSVVYPTKTTSINGLGVFEQLCKQAGSRCIVVNRLSSKLEGVETLILVGDSFHPPAKEARDWIEDWLAGQPGRTVVYFGRDFDAELYYREQTLDQVPAESRQRAMIDLMSARTQLDTQLFGQIPDDVFCRWFTLRIHEPRRDIQQFRGPWADAFAGESGSWPVRVLLEPPDPADAANKPKWPPPTATTTAPIQFGPGASQQDDEGPVVFTSHWVPWDIGDDETWESEWEKAPEPEVMLSGADGTPLVTRLTSERYPGSQILTVVNGAPFLNGTLVEPHFRKIARRIIADLQPAKRIALLPFSEYGILVSLLDEDEDEVAGLSVLTTWPMNIIMAHLAFLGVLICLALFPILGRPQKLRPPSLADFGQHAESLGQMLQRTGDVNFALNAVADYHRTVRGEVVPAWVESALEQRRATFLAKSDSTSPAIEDSSAAANTSADATSGATAEPAKRQSADAPVHSGTSQLTGATSAMQNPPASPPPSPTGSHTDPSP